MTTKSHLINRALQSHYFMVAQDIGFCDAEARRWQQARALTRRRGNLVALNRGPSRRAMGIWVLRRPRFSGPVEARIGLERPSRCSGRCDGPASPFSLMQCAIRETASTGKLHVETMLGRSRKCCGSLIGMWLGQELSKPLLRCGREWVGSKVSMILILPPQQGHGGGSMGAWD